MKSTRNLPDPRRGPGGSADAAPAARRSGLLSGSRRRRRIAEVRVAAPGAGYVWVRRISTAGTARPMCGCPDLGSTAPPAAAVWVPGHWKHGAHGWHWKEGRWK